MKIFKKVIAGVAALAIAVSGISFGALSRKEAKAAALSEAPDGTETVISEATLTDENKTATSAWGPLGTVNIPNLSSDIMQDPNVYVKVVATGVGNCATDNGEATFEDSIGWAGVVKYYRDWGADDTRFNVTMKAVAGSTSERAVCYAPITDFHLDEWNQISANLQCGHVKGVTIESVAVVRVKPFVYYETVISEETYPANTDIQLFDGRDFDSAKLSADAKLKIYLKTETGEGLTAGWGIGQVGYGEKWWDSTGKLADISSAGPNQEWVVTVPFSSVPDVADRIGMKTWAAGSFITKISIIDTVLHVDGVAFAEDAYEFTISADGKVPADVTPVVTVTPSEATNKKYTLTSGDTNVAKIVDGKIVPVGVGTTVITVKTEDGEFTDTCEVKVEAVKPTGITIAAVPTDVKGGDTVTLTATVTPANAIDKTVTWSSSDTDVATVDANGKVTFANVTGTKTVTVTAAAKADASVKATVTFTVEELVINTPVTGVTVSEDTLELVKGGSADLTAAVTPENATLKTVTWESADETIATVDSDGKVTATGVGTTTITVKTVDGGKTATCEVTVTAPKAAEVIVSVDGAEVDKLDMTAGDTASLTAKAKPDDAVQSFTFATSDETVVTVDEDGVLTAVAEGTATITVTADGASAEIEVTVTVKKEGSLDVDAKGEFKPSIEMSKEEVVASIKNVLSEEQLAAIEDGTAKIEIELNIANIDGTVSQEDKDLIADAIKELADGGKLNFMVMNYLDVTFGANVDGDVIKISETDGLITVSVALEKAVNGTYKVIRIHDGKAEVIDSELSEDGTRLTFKTDKFSTYAIVFADVASGDRTTPVFIVLLAIAGLAAALTAAVKIRKTAGR